MSISVLDSVDETLFLNVNQSGNNLDIIGPHSTPMNSDFNPPESTLAIKTEF